MTLRRASQTGFAAIAAIFLVVILAGLGAFMLSFSNTQQLTSAQDFLGTRAYWAARAGLEWGIASAPSCPASPAALSHTLTIDTFTVVVTCTSRAYTEAASTRTLVQFTSQASSATEANYALAIGSLGFVERSLSASVEF